MTTSKKKLLLPETMARTGWELARSRTDVDAVPFSPTVPNPEFRKLLSDAEGIALTSTPLRAADIAAAPRLRAVGRIGVGYDAVDVEALTGRGIPLMTCGTDNSPTVAEYALFMMLYLCKGATMDALPRQGRWHERYNFLPTELMNKTLLVVGFGRIGTRIARRCLAMDMVVEVYDPYVPAEAVRAAGCKPVADLDAALPRADFVTLHCPKTKETANLFDAARIAKMKPGARLINTARGGIVDEAALAAALKSGQLGGAAIDVFDSEPLPASAHFVDCPNLLLTPHIAGVSAESNERVSFMIADKVLEALR